MSSKTSGRPSAEKSNTWLRPYLESKDAAHVTRMGRVTYAEAMDAHLQKHSQMQKPYMSGDYQHMEYAFPPPLPIFRFEIPDFDFPDPVTTTTVTDHDIDDDIWSPDGEGGEAWRVCRPEQMPGTVECGKCVTWEIGQPAGDIIKASIVSGPGKISGSNNSVIRVCADSSAADGSVIKVKYVQTPVVGGVKYPNADECEAQTVVECDDCCDDPAYESPEWDSTNSAETIAPSSSATVQLLDKGCGPFQWQVAGTGFSLANAATSGRTNILYADATACGTAAFTVTDDCGNSCTGIVRCTQGQWSGSAYTERVVLRSGTGWDCKCGQGHSYTGCLTRTGKVWHTADEFNGYEGPLSSVVSNVLFVGSVGDVFFYVGTGNLPNPCNINYGDCNDTPYNYTAWQGTVHGQQPPMTPAQLSLYLLTYVEGAYEQNPPASGYYYDCPGGRIGVTRIYGRRWVC